MIVHGWLSGPLILTMALSLGWSQNLLAQAPVQSPTMRPTGGWQPSPSRGSASLRTDHSLSSASRQPAVAGEPAAVQTAYFQAQGSLSDGLPALPAAVAPSGSRVLPPFSGALGASAAGGSGPVTPPVLPHTANPPQLPQGNLNQSRGNTQPNFGAPAPHNLSTQENYQQQPYQQQPYQQQPYQQQPYQQQPYQQQPYQQQPGDGQFNRGGVPAQLASGELRSIQNERLASPVGGSQAGSSQASQPPQNSTQPSGQGARLTAQNVTTGYPFVTPPPSRGRYATSAYQPAVFQTAYQTPAVPAQLASNVSAAPPALAPAGVLPPTMAANQYLTPQQAALPQYRYPQPGIYPTAYQCTTPTPSFPTTGAVPGAYVPPTLPPNLTPGLYTPNNSGYTPLFSLGQENYNVQLGRGIIGQPTVYVPGQPVRNFMRYLSP